MKTFIYKSIFLAFVITSSTITSTIAQVGGVGINTIEPEGALHLNSSNSGMVFPRVALTAANVTAPVTNPTGAAVLPGTAIYNTATTNTGSFDVNPGIYVWNGTIWAPQYKKAEYQKFEQTGGCQRTTIKEGTSNPNPSDVENIAGLTSQTFTPNYTGTYRVEVKTNFGAGEIDDFTSDDAISLATTEGAFFFTMNGMGIDIDPTSSIFDYTEGWSYTHAYGAQSEIESPDVESNQVEHYGTLVYFLYLHKDEDYDFNLSISINTGNDYFVDNGDANEGQGHVGHDQPCSIEFTFLQ